MARTVETKTVDRGRWFGGAIGAGAVGIALVSANLGARFGRLDTYATAMLLAFCLTMMFGVPFVYRRSKESGHPDPLVHALTTAGYLAIFLAFGVLFLEIARHRLFAMIDRM